MPSSEAPSTRAMRACMTALDRHRQGEIDDPRRPAASTASAAASTAGLRSDAARSLGSTTAPTNSAAAGLARTIRRRRRAGSAGRGSRRTPPRPRRAAPRRARCARASRAPAAATACQISLAASADCRGAASRRPRRRDGSAPIVSIASCSAPRASAKGVTHSTSTKIAPAAITPPQIERQPRRPSEHRPALEPERAKSGSPAQAARQFDSSR